MKRRLFALFVAVVLGLAPGSIGFAHKDAKDHYADLEKVLFGYALNPAQRKGNIQLLEYASALALDQFSTAENDGLTKKISGTDKLAVLNDANILGIPRDIKDIDFVASASTHQSYTHRGWFWVYKENDLAKWSVRKNLLQATVEYIFDFDRLDGTSLGLFIGRKHDKRCDSFAALVYYVHLLGDWQEVKNRNDLGNKIAIPLALAHPGKTNRDIFYELEYHLAILFDDQQYSRTYQNMMTDIKELANLARGIVGSTGGVNTDEKFVEYKACVDELLNILNTYVHKLLSQEDFFIKAFPQ